MSTKIIDANIRAAQLTDIVPTARVDGEAPSGSTVQSILSLAGGGGLPLQLPIADGRYYTSPYLLEPDNEFVSPGADKIYGIPFIAHESKIWTEIGVRCTTGNAGDVARLAICADNGGEPGALVVDAGEVSLATTGNKVKTISQALNAGTWYWPTILVPSTNVAVLAGMPFGPSNALAGFIMGRLAWDTHFVCFEGDQAYGAAPSSFPSPVANENVMPLIWLRTGV